jgi:hypothetical protein
VIGQEVKAPTPTIIRQVGFDQPIAFQARGAVSKSMIYQSVITCPDCEHSTTETMPSDACRIFYECRSCGAMLRPRPGDCCVFCSYGSIPCPPVQAEKSDGCAGQDSHQTRL